MPRSREPGEKVWATIDKDDALRLDILVRRTHFPRWWHIREAIRKYVADVDPVDPPDGYKYTNSFKISD